MRLIDGDALIEKFNEKTDMAECLVDARTAERFATFCALADAVEEMPTVDAEVVVRCKDCKYRDLPRQEWRASTEMAHRGSRIYFARRCTRTISAPTARERRNHMIDYKKTCKWELGRYYEKLMAIDSLQDEIDMLTTRMEGIRSSTMDATPVQGGSSTAEERIINAICNRDNLTVNHELVKWQVRQMARGLSILTDQQRRILEVAVMRREYNAIDRLCDELHISRSELYRRMDEALKRYAICRYGVTEL